MVSVGNTCHLSCLLPLVTSTWKFFHSLSVLELTQDTDCLKACLCQLLACDLGQVALCPSFLMCKMGLDIPRASH